MFVAIDSNENRIYADDPVRYTDCFCPACKQPLIHKKGLKRIEHFAHRPQSTCQFADDRDNLSEWHRRMQSYFPRENIEKYFYDEEHDSYFRADVYIPESKMVLEFQNSPIKDETFWERTIFHLKHGRRIAWLYNESKEDSLFGKFKEYQEERSRSQYANYWYKWLYHPRTFVPIYNYKAFISICVFTGTEGDVFHRITNEFDKLHYVQFSWNKITMSKDMNPESFFDYDLEEKYFYRGRDGKIVNRI